MPTERTTGQAIGYIEDATEQTIVPTLREIISRLDDISQEIENLKNANTTVKEINSLNKKVLDELLEDKAEDSAKRAFRYIGAGNGTKRQEGGDW